MSQGICFNEHMNIWTYETGEGNIVHIIYVLFHRTHLLQPGQSGAVYWPCRSTEERDTRSAAKGYHCLSASDKQYTQHLPNKISCKTSQWVPCYSWLKGQYVVLNHTYNSRRKLWNVASNGDNSDTSSLRWASCLSSWTPLAGMWTFFVIGPFELSINPVNTEKPFLLVQNKHLLPLRPLTFKNRF